MLLKMKTASVESPVEVRMGGTPLRARAWYARKINPKESIRNNRGIGTAPIITPLPAVAAKLGKLKHAPPGPARWVGHVLACPVDPRFPPSPRHRPRSFGYTLLDLWTPSRPKRNPPANRPIWGTIAPQSVA